MVIGALIAIMRAHGGDLPAVEVKSAVGGLPESLTETMCAFANLPGGGIIILGLDERSGFSPVALANTASLAAGLANRARQSFDPPLHVMTEVERFEDGDIVVARISELAVSAKPCVVKRSGKAYLRFADGDYTLSQLEVDGFIANRTRPRFDEADVAGAASDDLDRQRVEDFVATARRADRRLATITDDADLLVKTGVLTRGGIPTVAGLLALGQYPQQFLPHCSIRAAVHADDASPTVRALDSATFTGPVAAMLEDATAWVARNSRYRIVADPATGRVREILDPPPIAVRELVANAILHRDLAEWASSRSIDLRITGGSLRITNPGGLYGITVDRLGVHPLTSARNRRLIEICKFVRTTDGNVVEALASGIPATIAALRDADASEPTFFDQGLAFTVILSGPNHRQTEHKRQPVMNAAMTRAETAVWTTLTTPATVDVIAAKLGLTNNAVHKRLATLRAKGLVDIHGGNGKQSTYHRANQPLR